ncbi:hypothetical protein YPPY55_1778, partial [Yersinia pestis PY-55]
MLVLRSIPIIRLPPP